MGKYITKFETQALFDEAKDNLDKPHVSLTVDNNTVHYLEQTVHYPEQPVVRPNLTFSKEMPVVLTGSSSLYFTMTSNIPLDKNAIMAHLCVKGNASIGPGNQDFEITNWFDMSSQISGNAGAGNVYVKPIGGWGGTTYEVTLQNSYMSARINEIVWND